MAEDSSHRSRWRGKAFLTKKPKDDDLAKHTEEKLRIDNDVMDFLAPSIAKSQQTQGSARQMGTSLPVVPQIDIAAAQRWPGARDYGKGSPSLRSGGPLSSSLKSAGGDMGRKRKKKVNLKVAFAKTAPEIIGEGGDESELPPVAVGKIRETAGGNKRMSEGFRDVPSGSLPAQRSLGAQPETPPSRARRAQTVNHGTPPSLSRTGWRSPPMQNPQEQNNVGNFVPGPLKRTGTGWSEAPESDRQELPSIDDDFRPKPLKRTQTGYSSIYDEDDDPVRPSFEESDPIHDGHTTSAGTDALASSGASAVPELELVAEESPHEYRKSITQNLDYYKASPTDPNSFSARLIHKMRAEEGRVLHEAVRNSMIMDDGASRSRSTSGASLGNADDSKTAQLGYRQSPTSSPQPPPIIQQPKPSVRSSFSVRKPPGPSSERPPLSASESFPAPTASNRLQVSGQQPSSSGGSSPVPPAHMSLSGDRFASSVGRDSPGQPTPSPYMHPAGSGPNEYFSQHNPGTPEQAELQPRSYRQSPQSQSLHQPYQQPPPIQTHHLPPQPIFQDSSHQPYEYPPQQQPPPVQYQQYQQSTLPQQRQAPPPNHPPKSLATRLGEAANSLPSPAGAASEHASNSNSGMSAQNSTPTTYTPLHQHNPAGDAALEDFTERVQHMSGIFRLTAEVVQPTARYSPKQWLRCCLWWFLRGRSGLEAIIRRSHRESNRSSPLSTRPGSLQGTDGGMNLTQPHVDLAKVVWMVQEVFPNLPSLQQYTKGGRMSLTAPSTLASARDAADVAAVQVLEGLEDVIHALKMLLGSCAKNDAMPPHASLIQGQDQSIWVQYPAWPPKVQAVTQTSPGASPTAYIPVHDTKADFAFGRMFVTVTLSTPEERLDPIPCVLNIMRERNTWGLKVCVCSQSEMFSVCIQDNHDRSKQSAETTLPGPSWRDIIWETDRARLFAKKLTYSTPGTDELSMTVDFAQPDFMSLVAIWNYTRGIGAAMMPGKSEKMLHEATTATLQFSEETNMDSPQHQQSVNFTRERINRCRVRIFAKYEILEEATGLRRIQRGYRVLAVTTPKVKTLSAVSLEVGNGKPIACETTTESASGESRPALVLRMMEQSRQATMRMTFNEPTDRQRFLDALTGIALRKGETVLAHSRFNVLGIEQASQAEAFSQSGRDPLRGIRWSDIMVIGEDEPQIQSAESAQMVMSDNFRIVARGQGLIITERLSLTQGELKLRFPATGTSASPSACISVFRSADPAPSTTITCFSSGPDSRMAEALSPLLTIAMTTATIETFHFPSLKDLHSFETALTSHNVIFDSLSSSFTVSHRRNMVPIYKKQHAHDVRIQVVKRDGESSALLLAFFEQYKLTEAMAFKLLSTDSFEKVDGGSDGKGKKISDKEMGGAAWGVKLIDAKFSMPALRKEHEDGDGGRWLHRRNRSKDSTDGRDSRNGFDGHAEGGRDPAKVAERFVSLDMLDYPGEHDDIVIGFDEENERDLFLEALPAGPQVHRGITLKRRI